MKEISLGALLIIASASFIMLVVVGDYSSPPASFRYVYGQIVGGPSADIKIIDSSYIKNQITSFLGTQAALTDYQLYENGTAIYTFHEVSIGGATTGNKTIEVRTTHNYTPEHGYKFDKATGTITTPQGERLVIETTDPPAGFEPTSSSSSSSQQQGFITYVQFSQAGPPSLAPPSPPSSPHVINGSDLETLLFMQLAKSDIVGVQVFENGTIISEMQFPGEVGGQFTIPPFNFTMTSHYPLVETFGAQFENGTIYASDGVEVVFDLEQ